MEGESVFHLLCIEWNSIGISRTNRSARSMAQGGKNMDEEKLALYTTDTTDTVAVTKTAECDVTAEVTTVTAPTHDLDTPEPNIGMTVTPDRTHGLRHVFRILLYNVIPTLLSATAVTVYAALAAVIVTDADITPFRILQAVLGELSGGADHVRLTKTDRSVENSAAQPMLPLPTPGETAEVSDVTEVEVETEAELERIERDLSSKDPDSLGLINETPYEVDMSSLLADERAVPPYSDIVEIYGSTAPVVLILHTHATEAYAASADEGFRSTSDEQSVVSVGAVIAERLTESGISTLHCTKRFDSPDFNMAYYNAALTIREYLEEYPSISYIFDIHRDSIVSDDGYVCPTVEVGGEPVAQMMFVVGTDHGGSGHVGWRDNLALAARLQKSLTDDTPRLMRSVNLRSASFNEQYTKGSLLIEIGSCASTLTEAVNAAELLSVALVSEILGK